MKLPGRDLERWIRGAWRRLWYGPDQFHGQRQEWGWYCKLAITGASDLLATLERVEATESTFPPDRAPLATHLFLSSVLRDVQKVGGAIKQWDILLRPPHDFDEVSHPTLAVEIQRALLASTREDQWLKIRKMIETLSDLCCFRTTNEDAYFRHYLLCTELERLKGQQSDYLEFYTCDNQTIARNVSMILKEIESLEADRIDVSKCWYLKEQSFVSKRPRLARQLVQSRRQRMMIALKNAKPGERIALGLSYDQIFGQASRHIHFRPAGNSPRADLSVISRGIGNCGLLVSHLLHLCQEFSGQVPHGVNRILQESTVSNQFPSALLRFSTRNRAALGDFVVVGGAVGEVLAVKPSAYGYESYRVKFLVGPRGESWAEEEFTPQVVRLFCSQESVRDVVEMSIRSGKLSAEDIVEIRKDDTIPSQLGRHRTMKRIWKVRPILADSNEPDPNE
jgi:hypothetical protein